MGPGNAQPRQTNNFGGGESVLLIEEKSPTFSDNCFGSHLSSNSRAEQRSWRVETFVLVTCEEDFD